jgi:hypothetical protein
MRNSLVIVSSIPVHVQNGVKHSKIFANERRPK